LKSKDRKSDFLYQYFFEQIQERIAQSQDYEKSFTDENQYFAEIHLFGRENIFFGIYVLVSLAYFEMVGGVVPITQKGTVIIHERMLDCRKKHFIDIK
jgi:hypothetical protein